MRNAPVERTAEDSNGCDRRSFLKAAGIAGAALVLGRPDSRAQNPAPERIATNVADALNIPRTRFSLPGLFPGRVVEARAADVIAGGRSDTAQVRLLFEKGLEALTGRSADASFGLFFSPDDVVGIKVNPVGAGLISTRPETVEAVIAWLARNGLPKSNIVIWDRFDYMLADAGFTPERFPGVSIEGLQTMDEAAAEGKSADNSRWRGPDGKHVSAGRFDPDRYYWADVEAEKDNATLNQHVFNGRHSFFGKLVTSRLTKIINIPVFKNCGNGISMATKNLAYGSICNTGRLHKPLFFDVCVEVLAFPEIRDKLVLNVTDGLKGQYDGGPSAAAQFIWPFNTLFLGTDPFTMDSVCHGIMIAKRKAMGVAVNEHPRFTDYFRYAERLGLGVTGPQKVQHIRLES
ncbi:DUF362 domain-containing protein [bacterium]|nr:DUF362 domain-containing protein [bacterium]